MIDGADIVLLGTVCLLLLGSRRNAERTLRRDAVTVQKYRLYKVRDELVYLVAIGKLREADFIFQTLYKSTNYLINETKSITLKAWINTLDKGRKKGLDPTAQKIKVKLEKELVRLDNDEAVVRALASFGQAMNEILVDNSWVLRNIV